MKLTLSEADIDFKKYEGKIIGRVTKGRYKAIQRWARKMSAPIGYCGHEHDCCGCLCGQHASAKIIGNTVRVTVTQHFNY